MKLRAFVSAGMAAVLAGCAGSAPAPSHPHYSAAIDDLRAARTILDRDAEYTAIKAQYDAILNIDRAVLEMKHAAVDTGEEVEQPPGAADNLDDSGRLHRARELIVAARYELRFKEDNPDAKDYRERARDYVGDALSDIDRTIRDRRMIERKS